MDFSPFSCLCCSFHSSSYDDSSDTIRIYENHIHFLRALGIPYKSLFFTFVDPKKQQQLFAHKPTGNRRTASLPLFSRKAQTHTFRSFHIFPLPFAISPKEDFILLTQQTLFPFLKSKAEKTMSYPHPLTQSYLHLGI